MADTKPFLVAGEWKTGSDPFDVKNPFDGSLIARVGTPTPADVETAVAAADAAFDECRKLPVHARSEALMHISKRLEERQDEVAEVICKEGGKPLKWAKVEAARAVSTFRWAAEVLRSLDGEIMRLDTEASLGTRAALIRRFPRGPV